MNTGQTVQTGKWSLEDLVHLNMTQGIGAIGFQNLIARFGSTAAILAAPENQLVRVKGLGPKRASKIAASRAHQDPCKEIEAAASCGIRIIGLGDPDYPALLKAIYDPPLVLYVKGDLLESDALAVAIVGARQSSYYGQAQARKLARDLTARGLTIVSGLARGIDASAHEGALEAHGRTLAVMGCGLDTIYPPEHDDLAERITHSGTLISEFPMSTRVDKAGFPKRNRIIAGLSAGVVVVEGTRRSGAMITARCAGEQGREVFAVPGKIDSPLSQGPHALIRDGAKLVASADDVLEEFGDWWGSLTLESQEKPTVRLRLNEREMRVMEVLEPSDPQGIEQIIHATGHGASEIQSVLLALEMRGLVAQLPGKQFVKKGA